MTCGKNTGGSFSKDEGNSKTVGILSSIKVKRSWCSRWSLGGTSHREYPVKPVKREFYEMSRDENRGKMIRIRAFQFE